MGFALIEDEAVAPGFPHIACCDGFAWMDQEGRRPCFSANVSAPAIIVARAIDPGPNLPGIDHMIAISNLNQIQRQRIFKDKCPACGTNHLQAALKYVRALRDYVHPGAIEAIRAAKVPDYLMRRAWNVKEDTLRPDASERERESFESRRIYIPLWSGEPDRTLAAQIAWAEQYALKARYPSRRGRPAKIVLMERARPKPITPTNS